MNRSVLTILMLLIAGSGSVLAAETGTQVLPELARGLSLVEAVAESSTPGADDELRATMKIVNVFAGDRSCLGKTFEYYQPPLDRSGSNGPHRHIALAANQKSLWTVGASGGAVSPAYGAYWGVLSPIVDNETGYPQAIAQAKRVQELLTANESQRLQILSKLIESSENHESAWAVEVLVRNDPAAVASLKERCIKSEKIPPEGKLAIDKVALADPAWAKSQERQKMLTSLAKNTTAQADLNTLLDYVSNLSNFDPDQIDIGTLTECVDAIATNPKNEFTVRQMAISTLGRRAKTDRARVLDSLMKYLTKSNDVQVRVAAAYAIKNNLKLDEKEQSAIRDVRSSATDESLLRALDAILTGK